MKRSVSLLLVLCMALALFTFGVSAEDHYADGFFYVLINSGAEAEITQYCGIEQDLVIPETLAGYPVTSVRDNIKDCDDGDKIVSISLPKTLKNFSANALLHNKSLSKISLDEENTAFSLVDGVLYRDGGETLVLYPADREDTSFKVPEGVTKIGAGAFYGAENLQHIRLPLSLEEIESTPVNYGGAFEACTALQSVVLRENLASVGDSAFVGCTSLSRVDFLYTTKKRSVGMTAFLDCPNLSEICFYTDVDFRDNIQNFGFYHTEDGEEAALENFTVFAMNNSKAQQYAANWGFDFASLGIRTDFLSGSVYITGTQSDLAPISFAQGSCVSVAPTDTALSYFSGVSTAVRCEPIFTLSKDAELPESFEHDVFYSFLGNGTLNASKKLYAFVEKDGEVPEYVTSGVYRGEDAFGYEADFVNLETAEIGEDYTFLAVQGDPKPGCVTGGDEITIADLTLLAKYLAGWEVKPQLLNSDLTGDGKIAIDDLTRLAKHLADWQVELVPFAEYVW